MRAGLDDVTPHVLKHTAITWAMQNRIDLGKRLASSPPQCRPFSACMDITTPTTCDAADTVSRRPQNVRVTG